MPIATVLLSLPAESLPLLAGLVGAWLHVAFPLAPGLSEEVALATAGAP